jgi:hypothetical protein
MSLDKDAVSSRTLPDGTVLVESARGTARLTRLGPSALLCVCTGVLSTDFYTPMVAPAQRELDQSGRLSMFVDGWELRSVDTGFREAWTEWFKGCTQHFAMRLLVRTKLMDMAASLANLFTGMNVVKTYCSIASWERACRQDFPSFRGRTKAAG